MAERFSWRYALALLVTVTVAWLIWHGTRLILTEPVRSPSTRLMHVSLATPPTPPAPPKVAPKPPNPIVKQQARRTPVETSPHAVGPPASANAPVSSPNATATPPSPPQPPAETANVSLENAYAASVNAAINEQKRYPMSKDARLQQPSGTVVVWIVLDRSGALLDSGIEQSAGSILDHAALESVRRATYPQFPEGVWPGESRHRFTVSLYFHPG